MINPLNQPLPPGITKDFRARATLGVALTALTLLLPFVIISAVQGRYLMALCSFALVAILGVSAILVLKGRNHEPLALFGLVPCGMVAMVYVSTIDDFAASLWCFPAVVGGYCMLSQRNAWIANLGVVGCAIPTAWSSMDWLSAARVSATLLAVSLFAAILVRVIDHQQRRLVFQLEHDSLTGLLNRVSLQRELSTALRLHREQGRPMVALMLDIDHFKAINDCFGHEVGDRVLCELTRVLGSHLRECDRAFRMGGEEFLMLLPDVDAATGQRIAERIRLAIAGGLLLQHHATTVSIGVAELRSEDDARSWIRRSDEALYQAKSDGRDRVHVAGLAPARFDQDESTEQTVWPARVTVGAAEATAVAVLEREVVGERSRS